MASSLSAILLPIKQTAAADQSLRQPADLFLDDQMVLLQQLEFISNAPNGF